jgi:hypothetical protein
VSIPVRLNVEAGNRSATLTRDEVGRVRATGQLPIGDQVGEMAEADMIRAGTALFDRVLSRSLGDWGIPEITSNDATGRGD